MSIILRVLYKSCQYYAHFLCPGAEYYGRGAFCFFVGESLVCRIGIGAPKVLAQLTKGSASNFAPRLIFNLG